jgi:hypothetical protein
VRERIRHVAFSKSTEYSSDLWQRFSKYLLKWERRRLGQQHMHLRLKAACAWELRPLNRMCSKFVSSFPEQGIDFNAFVTSAIVWRKT